MKLITEIVGEIVDSLNFTFEAESVVVEGNNYRLNTCNTYWLTKCDKVVIATFNYEIIEVVLNESILVKPSLQSNPAPTPGLLFPIPKPTYRYGTARAINAELSKISDTDKKLFFWLYGVSKETFISDKSSIFERESPIRVFIFATADPDNWFTNDHFDIVINQLAQLFNAFRDKIENNTKDFGNIQDFEYIYLPDWGKLIENTGFTAKIFDEQWSGIEGQTTLNIKKPNCKECN